MDDFSSLAPSPRFFLQIPVVVGGVKITPGDVIVGDDDGVVVLGNDLDKIKVWILGQA